MRAGGLGAMMARRIGRAAAHSQAVQPPDAGFTLVETLLVVALIGTLAAIALPNYFRALEKARVTRAIGDIKNISLTITLYQMQTGSYPDSLSTVGFGQQLDPWGKPYEYLKLAGVKGGKGKARKDKNLVPLNSDYDLYSMGKDGSSTSPLTAKASRDDVVRANNGGFIGLASDY
jgi:general secretion pathway protein G